ncbi:hypothetical protein ABMA75_12035 [Halobacteriovorax sp. ZH4_bin.1]|uniref:hypothetical protein n=1 Tax=unclassified Halobacteriovorax TaxID=2639665 RepID=UPI003715552B
MRGILFLILTIYGLCAYSSTDFKYQDRSNDFQGLAKALIAEYQYQDFDGFYQNYSEHFLANQVFVKGAERFFVKLGLETDAGKLNKFIPLAAGDVVNFKVGKTPISIYFENIAKVEKYKIVKSVKGFVANQMRKGSFKKYTLIDLFIPKAHAVECNNQLEEIVNIDDLQAPVDRFNKDYLMAQASGCVQKALSAAWAKTGGLVQDVGSGIWNFIKSPVKSAKKFWNSAVDTYETTKEFITQIDQKLASLGEALGALSLESQIQLVCSLVGSLGSNVLVNVIMRGPLGLGNAMTSLADLSKRVTSSAKFLQLLDQLKSAGKLGKEKVGELINKILTTKNKDGLEKVNSLSSANYVNLTVEYAACAL